MFFRYKILLDVGDDNKTEIGIVEGEDLTSVVEYLVSYYGSKIYDIICLRAIGDNVVLPINLEYDYVLDEIEKDAVW